MYTYTYMYIHIHIYAHIYIYIMYRYMYIYRYIIGDGFIPITSIDTFGPAGIWVCKEDKLDFILCLAIEDVEFRR